MRQILDISPDTLRPRDADVIRSLGYQNRQQVSRQVEKILSEAYRLYLQKANPAGILLPVTIPEFEYIFNGNGQNELQNPVMEIFPRAEHLALMAFTLGAEISNLISRLFETHEYTHATLLDAIASSATDQASKYLEDYFYQSLYKKPVPDPARGVLLYSPGYCGWHISGQQKLFDFIQPVELGLNLNENYLMSPLKSLTGVLIGGDSRIHLFKNNYFFCRKCKDQSCLSRQQSLTSNKTV